MLPHPLGKEAGEPHPHIVLSVDYANEYEGTFVAVMITASKLTKDEMSFPLDDTMFDKGLDKKNCHARMHLLMLAMNKEVLGKIGKPLCKMKKEAFDRMMKAIGAEIFNFSFTPL